MVNPVTANGAVAALLAGVLLLLGACSSVPPAASVPPVAAVPSVAGNRFCAFEQQRMASTRLEVQNVVRADYNDFVYSKPTVRPLETEEYHWYDDEAHSRLRMISCKMKTVDHLRAEYGAESAGDEGTCSGLNAATLQSVLAGFSSRDRRRLRFDQGRAVVLDPDQVTDSGPIWLAPFRMVSVAGDGTLHILSKGMRNDWNDPRLRDAPVRFRGTRYCHLIAPDYLQRILLGDVSPPTQ